MSQLIFSEFSGKLCWVGHCLKDHRKSNNASLHKKGATIHVLYIYILINYVYTYPAVISSKKSSHICWQSLLCPSTRGGGDNHPFYTFILWKGIFLTTWLDHILKGTVSLDEQKHILCGFWFLQIITLTGLSYFKGAWQRAQFCDFLA